MQYFQDRMSALRKQLSKYFEGEANERTYSCK